MVYYQSNFIEGQGMGRSFKKSFAWKERAKAALVGGGQPHKQSQPPEPVMVAGGKGAHFWDADGNDYIDYLMGYGPMILGHAYPTVIDAVASALERGNVYNFGHTLEIELAEKLVEIIPSADRVAYFVGGSDATTGALKFARAYTEKEKVIRCGYHGWHDWCHNTRGHLPASAESTLSVGFNDIDALEDLFKEHPGEIACLIMEPSGSSLPDDGYLENVKRLVNSHDALLIFDEVKTGFRYALGGAQEYFGITPDMSVFGKALANGFATAVVVGRKDIMDEVSNVWVAATFHGEVSLVAAAMATIAELEAKDGVEFMWKQGTKLLDGYREMSERLGIDQASIGGIGPMPFFGLSSENDRQSKFRQTFYEATLDGGLYLPPGHIWFMSISHTDEDIAKTLNVSEDALKLAKSKS